MEVVEIFLFNELLGRLGRDTDKGETYLSINPNFISKYGENILIGLNCNEKTQIFSDTYYKDFEHLPPIFYDSLPDGFGNKLLLQKYNKNQIKEFNPLQKLTYIGKRGKGAIEYKPEIETKTINTIDLSEIENISQMVLNQKQDLEKREFQEGLENLIQIGSTAGGAGAKIFIAIDSKNNLLPGDIIHPSQEVDYYLLKMGEELNCKLEYAYYLMAKDCGIKMMDSFLYKEKYFVTKRYDRNLNGEKTHTISMSAVLNKNFNGRNNYEMMYDLIMKTKYIPNNNLEKLFRQMVFNFMFLNTDDHFKNFSLLYDKEKREWNLTPAYDLSLPFDYKYIGYKNISHWSSFNGKTNNHSLKEIMEYGQNYLRLYDVKGIVKKIVDVSEKIKFYLEKATIEKEISNKISKGMSEHINQFSYSLKNT